MPGFRKGSPVPSLFVRIGRELRPRCEKEMFSIIYGFLSSLIGLAVLAPFSHDLRLFLCISFEKLHESQGCLLLVTFHGILENLVGDGQSHNTQFLEEGVGLWAL